MGSVGMTNRITPAYLVAPTQITGHQPAVDNSTPESGRRGMGPTSVGEELPDRRDVGHDAWRRSLADDRRSCRGARLQDALPPDRAVPEVAMTVTAG